MAESPPPQEPFAIRQAPPRTAILNKRMVIAVVFLIGIFIVGLLLRGQQQLKPQAQRTASEPSAHTSTTTIAEVVQQLPKTYKELAARRQPPEDPGPDPRDLKLKVLSTMLEKQKQQIEALQHQLAEASKPKPRTSRANTRPQGKSAMAKAREAAQLQAIKDEEAARSASLSLWDSDSAPGAPSSEMSVLATTQATDNPGGDTSETLPWRLRKPVSKYEIKAGWFIPATLITGLNSDLPGQVVATVREHVRDSASGEYILIPQGTRLIGAYNAEQHFGQERVFFAFTRMVFPNGQSMALGEMPGADLAGFAGARDRVNHHYLKLLSAVFLSSVLSVGTRASQGDVQERPTLAQEFAADVSTNINRAGQQIVKKTLAIQPTLEIRPGMMFNVVVNKDLVLPKYGETD